MPNYAGIDERIQQGYQKIYEQRNCAVGCDDWLEAWESIKAIMEKEGLHDIHEIDKKYPFTQFISNYVQDLEMELGNAGLDDRSYYSKRIKYCRELIERCESSKLMTANTRWAAAESYFKLGEHAESDRLFEEMIQDDPDWGWAYIGWAECYAWHLNEPNYERATDILIRGLRRTGLLEREEAAERAVEFSEKLGDSEKRAFCRQELTAIRRSASVTANKVGRNEPCPCGSGKKYKKCCGGT
jgi:tetratricopeptide (TPR) repeat protein